MKKIKKYISLCIAFFAILITHASASPNDALVNLLPQLLDMQDEIVQKTATHFDPESYVTLMNHPSLFHALNARSQKEAWHEKNPQYAEQWSHRTPYEH